MSPISKERQALYPADWPAISARVRAEANNRCWECGVPNGARGYRYPGTGGAFREVSPQAEYCATEVLRDLRGWRAKLTTIVLTVHHLDGDPTNNSSVNLLALCQRCHLRADQRLRRERKTEGSET